MNVETEPVRMAGAQRFGGWRGGDLRVIEAALPSQERGPHPQTKAEFVRDVATWFVAARQLRFVESINLASDTPDPQFIQGHKRVCTMLIAFGEQATAILESVEDIRSLLGMIGITPGCVIAETEVLRSNYRMVHDSSMSIEEADEILGKAFCGARETAGSEVSK